MKLEPGAIACSNDTITTFRRRRAVASICCSSTFQFVAMKYFPLLTMTGKRIKTTFRTLQKREAQTVKNEVVDSALD